MSKKKRHRELNKQVLKKTYTLGLSLLMMCEEVKKPVAANDESGCRFPDQRDVGTSMTDGVEDQVHIIKSHVELEFFFDSGFRIRSEIHKINMGACPEILLNQGKNSMEDSLVKIAVCPFVDNLRRLAIEQRTRSLAEMEDSENSDVFFELSVRYMTGIGAPKDIDSAARLCEMGARLGGDYQEELMGHIRSGKTEQLKGLVSAERLFDRPETLIGRTRMLAEQGDPGATFNLALFCLGADEQPAIALDAPLLASGWLAVQAFIQAKQDKLIGENEMTSGLKRLKFRLTRSISVHFEEFGELAGHSEYLDERFVPYFEPA